MNSIPSPATLSAAIHPARTVGPAALSGRWHGLSGWFVRPARGADLDGLMALAETADPGMTNLPANRAALASRLDRSAAAFAAPLTAPVDEIYMLVLDDGTGRVRGSACILSKVGQTWPFYSYRLTQVVHHSPSLGQRHDQALLQITNDYGGATEVGGLFVDPALRASGAGRLLAQSRYLFIATHRARFGETVMAELRGWVAPGEGTPFWDAVGRQFCGGMSLWDADRHCAINGNQLIADLMPRDPLYLAVLPEAARAAVGRVHASSAPALRLLEQEGLRFRGHVDLFDAGPMVDCPTAQLRTLVHGRRAVIGAAGDPAATQPALLASGELAGFRCWADHVAPENPGTALRIGGQPGQAGPGDEVFHVALPA